MKTKELAKLILKTKELREQGAGLKGSGFKKTKAQRAVRNEGLERATCTKKMLILKTKNLAEVILKRKDLAEVILKTKELMAQISGFRAQKSKGTAGAVLLGFLSTLLILSGWE